MSRRTYVNLLISKYVQPAVVSHHWMDGRTAVGPGRECTQPRTMSSSHATKPASMATAMGTHIHIGDPVKSESEHAQW